MMFKLTFEQLLIWYWPSENLKALQHNVIYDKSIVLVDLNEFPSVFQKV